MEAVGWYTKSVEETLVEYSTPLGGLTSEEAEKRLDQFGENKLVEPEKTSAILRFLSQYHDPMSYLLIGAGLLALITHPDKPGDAIFIAIVLTANAIFGYWQENNAEKEIGALKQIKVSQCVV